MSASKIAEKYLITLGKVATFVASRFWQKNNPVGIYKVDQLATLLLTRILSHRRSAHVTCTVAVLSSLYGVLLSEARETEKKWKAMGSEQNANSVHSDTQHCYFVQHR